MSAGPPLSWELLRLAADLQRDADSCWLWQRRKRRSLEELAVTLSAWSILSRRMERFCDEMVQNAKEDADAAELNSKAAGIQALVDLDRIVKEQK